MRLMRSLMGFLGATATASATIFAANITEATYANYATSPQPEDPVSPLIHKAIDFALKDCALYFKMRHLNRRTTEILIMMDPMLEKELMEEEEKVLAKTEGTKITCVKLADAVLKDSWEEVLEALEEYYGCGV